MLKNKNRYLITLAIGAISMTVFQYQIFKYLKILTQISITEIFIYKCCPLLHKWHIYKKQPGIFQLCQPKSEKQIKYHLRITL